MFLTREWDYSFNNLLRQSSRSDAVRGVRSVHEVLGTPDVLVQNLLVLAIVLYEAHVGGMDGYAPLHQVREVVIAGVDHDVGTKTRPHHSNLSSSSLQ